MDRKSSGRTLQIPKLHSSVKIGLHSSNQRIQKSNSEISLKRSQSSQIQLFTGISNKPSINIEYAQSEENEEIIHRIGPGRSSKNKLTYKKRASISMAMNKNPIFSSQSYGESSKGRKTSQFSKCIEDRNLIRLRIFDVEVSKGLNLMYGLPFQKYNKMLMQDENFQYVLITNELNVLKDRVNALNYRIGKVIAIQPKFVQLFGLISQENQQCLNAKLEETIGILKEISRLILFDYGDNPSLISISPFPILPNKGEVENEHDTFVENAQLFNASTKAFAGSVVGYNILSKKKKIILELHHNLLLFQFLARARLNVNELIEESSFHSKYQYDKVNWAKSIYSLSGSPSGTLSKESRKGKITANSNCIDDKMWNEMMNAIAIGENMIAEEVQDKQTASEFDLKNQPKPSTSKLPAIRNLDKASSSTAETKRSSSSKPERAKQNNFSNISNLYESYSVKKLIPPKPKREIKSYQKLKVKKAIEEAIRHSKSQSIVFELRKIDPDHL